MRHVREITPISQLIAGPATRLHASAVLAGVEAGATAADRRHGQAGTATEAYIRPASKSDDSPAPLPRRSSHPATAERAARPDRSPTLPHGRAAHPFVTGGAL